MSDRKQAGDRGQLPESTEIQRAEADTVMFASLRAVLPNATTENRFAGWTTVGRARRPRAASWAARLRTSAPRRVWVSRGVLALIMVLQALLTLRMSNTAFEDEGLYLYVGHLEIRHFLHGAALQGDYPSYFSGAPVLYPVLGALADSVGGLAAARALSLLEMLAVTGLIYAMSRRLFNERVGLCAAVLYAAAEPALFLGNLATYDATALFLLTLATWLAVRLADHARPLYLLAAPVLALAVATKYATLLFVPSVVGLAGLAAAPRLGRRALVNVGRARRGHRRAADRCGVPGRAGLPDRVQVHHPRPVRGRRVGRIAGRGRRAVDRRAVPDRGRRRGRLRDAAVHRAGRAAGAGRRPAAAGAARRADGGQRAARPDRADPDPHRDLAVQARRVRADDRGPDCRGSAWPGSSATTSAGLRSASRSGACRWRSA